MGMQTSRSLARIGWLIIGLALGAAGLASGSLQQPTEGPEVLARGPLHEAFAAPVVYNPAPGAIVPKPPPSEQIEEQPPDQKPQGRDVEWIPGYWSWDDERADYLWISGIWRDIPPGRQWVPGYWGPAEGGFRWTSGFWSPLAANGRVSYLPTPPQSLEIGPNTPQPEPDYLWSPGSWTWYENRYLWRPGFWVQSQPDWVWVPPSYVPTPGGYVYVDGYWDHPVDRRGVIYAPLVFSPAYIAQPAYVYTPSIVLSIGGLTANLFIRPSCHAYYFGDYYGYARSAPGPPTSPGSPTSSSGSATTRCMRRCGRTTAGSRAGTAGPHRVRLPGRARRVPPGADLRGPAGPARSQAGPGRGRPGPGDRPRLEPPDGPRRGGCPTVRAGPPRASGRAAHPTVERPGGPAGSSPGRGPGATARQRPARGPSPAAPRRRPIADRVA